MDLLGRHDIPPVERFLARVERTESGCWIWIGATRGHRYASFMVDGKTVMAHRWSYEHYVGPIPEGLQIDHKCGITICVNPEHLRALTARENVLAYHREQRTFCGNGHDITQPGATVMRLGGKVQVCRQCGRDRKNRYRRKIYVPAPEPTTCKNGHPKELSYRGSDGKFHCRECRRARKARYKAST